MESLSRALIRKRKRERQRRVQEYSQRARKQTITEITVGLCYLIKKYSTLKYYIITCRATIDVSFNTIQYNNRVHVRGHSKYVLGPTKMSLRRAQNIFMPKNIEKIKTEKITKKQSEQFSGLKYILARQNLHFSPQNAPQCPTK